MRKVRSLRTRVIISFCLFALFLSAMFSLFNFLFLYSVEDNFLFSELKGEATFLEEHFSSTSEWTAPRKKYMAVYHGVDSFPADLREQFLSQSNRKEFYGDQGRHYHLIKLNASTENIFLVSEVSQHLIIRPIRHKILIFFGTATLIMTLLACFLAYRVAGKTIAPLTHLSELVKNTNPSQLPSGFALNYPKNEIGTLARALENSMKRIASFIDREKHFNRDVSHDLRTPIAVVQGGVELIKKSASLSKNDLKLIERIESANIQMSQTVQTLLELAREEHTQNRWEPLNVLPVVEKSIVQQAYILKDKNVAVNVDIQTDESVTASIGVLEILLSNLISNAFQYTFDGQVNIKLSNNILSVFNTADGLDETMLDTLVKGEKSQGFGLGLSIVKRLCEHHQLKFKIKEINSGVGVIIEFPEKVAAEKS